MTSLNLIHHFSLIDATTALKSTTQRLFQLGDPRTLLHDTVTRGGNGVDPSELRRLEVRWDRRAAKYELLPQSKEDTAGCFGDSRTLLAVHSGIRTAVTGIFNYRFSIRNF